MFKRRVSQVFRTLPTWPDPKASIGQQIPSSRIGSRKAWWPRGTGPALEAFERNILGEIENALRTLDLTNADLCIKLYMIGRNEDNANPIIMICCLNRDVRSTAKELVRASDILDRYPGFGLGAAALPLECKVPLRRFAGLEATGQNRESSSSASPSTHQAGGLFLPTEKVEGTQQDSNSKFSGAKDVEESELRVNSYRPKIGRRLCAQNLDQGLRFATGGVVVDINEKYYQLTVGHLMKPEFPIQTLPRALSSVDLEECSFDGQSDDDEMDEEVDQQLITSSGSITSNDSRADPESPQQVSTRPGTVDHGALTLSQNSSSQEGSSKTSPLLTPEWFRTSCTIPVKAKQGSLDYMLVSVSFQSLRDMKSDINKISELPLLRIQHIGHMIDQPRIVWVASSSIGLIRGTLSPGAMSYRHHGEEGFQRLLRVQLESPVVEGDCGSAVVDAASGDLYGQIVLGVPGTTFAYIVTATEIFEDIAHSQGDLPAKRQHTLYRIEFFGNKYKNRLKHRGYVYGLIYVAFLRLIYLAL
ncbi:hypothetical protein F4778DRAFT_780665 [Xylariomycetidae sp. FL2044]|nr:hypothetical protein F4778DRAFT_780665 [Xylariomycetidae sp. FL2044]